MKKLCTIAFVLSVSGGLVLAENHGNKAIPVKQPVKFETNAAKQLKVAQWEAKSTKSQVFPTTIKKVKPHKIQSTADVSFADLGVSINPFGTFLNGRNYVSANPTLNSVAVFRRGWQTDPNVDGGSNGNKLFYDVNTQGGNEVSWQIGQGPVYTHTLYDTNTNNYGARYPQGLLWNPPLNTNPQNAIALGNPRILDGTNDAWGGLGLGWKTVGPTLAKKQKVWSTEEILHFRTESMEVTSLGNVFLVEPEEDLTGGITFTDKVFVYKYTYNTATNNFDSLVVPLPFPNEGGDYQTQMGGTAIAFGPDGLTGYVAVSAYNNAFDSVGAYVPYICKTIDGGVTWSPWKLMPINFAYINYDSPGMDCLRDQLFVSNYVKFTDEGTIVPGTRGEEYSHKVDYIVNDFDLTVDAFGYAHYLANVSVSGFGDTLASEPSSITYYPGYGSWNIDLSISNLQDEPSGYLISTNESLNGLWGDPSVTADQIIEGNRPQVTRSSDGSVIAFCWFDTDQEAHPQSDANTNSNPDMWIQKIKVTGPGIYRRDIPRNVTKGSDYDGNIIQGSVAPQMLNTAQGYKVAATCVSLPPYPGTAAVWPTTHVYINNLDIPSATDSFPVLVSPCYPVVSNGSILSNPAVSSLASIVPNPNNGEFKAQFSSSIDGKATIQIVDHIGRLISSKEVYVNRGMVQQPFNLKSASNGLYFISIQLPDGSRIKQKIVKN